MSQLVPYEILTLGANNIFVWLFKKLVDEKYDIEITEDSLKDVTTAEFDKTLYDRAVALPESKSISYEYSYSSNGHIYGEFKGSVTYKDFEGNIDPSKAKLVSTLGWLVLSGDSDTYGIFRSYLDNKKYIISLKDFENKPIIKDFTPLFDKLKDDFFIKHSNYIIKDNLSISGLAVSLANDTANGVNDIVYSNSHNKDISVDLDKFNSEFTDHIHDLTGSKWATATRDTLYVLWRAALDAYMQVNTYKALVTKYRNCDPKNPERDYGLYPEQIGVDRKASYTTRNTSAYNNIQAVIYTIDPGAEASSYADLGTANENRLDSLICFQTPESISYTAQASYESSSPRGSQIPFQYYQNANQTEISFTLKWCNDEVKEFIWGKDINEDKKSNITLQDIADLAEDFTRPWERSNGSIYPKICRVVLPGISEIGYISSASINYTGDMAGDLYNGTGADVLGSAANEVKSLKDTANSGLNGYHSTMTNYFYNQLEITFNLIVIKDIKLRPVSDSAKNIVISSMARNNSVDAFESTEEVLKIAAATESAIMSSLEATERLTNATNDLLAAVSEYK